MSQSKANHGLVMSIDRDSRWNVTDASTLNSMLNNGMLDLSSPASSLMVIKNANSTGGDFAQSSSGSLMLALNDMTLLQFVIGIVMTANDCHFDSQNHLVIQPHQTPFHVIKSLQFNDLMTSHNSTGKAIIPWHAVCKCSSRQYPFFNSLF